MEQYGIYPSAVVQARGLRQDGQPVGDAVAALFEDQFSRPDGMTLALVLTTGVDLFVDAAAAELDCSADEVREALWSRYSRQLAGDFSLTGAEAAALLLRQEQVATAFAYAGTSELAVCDALARLPGLRLINGRGDKEAAFMAAGASLLRPNHGVAVLHGTRGLTNAAGAIADANRNEIPTLFLVGLPSTSSARFLPPHGEENLIPTIGHFVKHWHEVTSLPSFGGHSEATGGAGAVEAAEFVAAFRRTLAAARTRPYGPVIFGLPQDAAEASWIPWRLVAQPSVTTDRPTLPEMPVEQAVRMLEGRRVAILIDDYLLRYDGARQALAEFATRCAAPVLQARYRRGFMLFERLTKHDVPSFLGWLDPMSPYHRKLLESADVLVTLEDRNLYRRVVGDLPVARKIAITSDARRVLKNEYLAEGDLLLEGDVVDTMGKLSQLLPAPPEGQPGASQSWYHGIVTAQPHSALLLDQVVAALRSGIAETLADLLGERDLPVIVDDSSMFGGMVCEEYDRLPNHVRIFGDHGGFVGGGIGYATGLALGNPEASVLCLLGDQGFINGLQGLVAAGQERARLVYVVCNNRQAVSLLKQSSANNPRWFDGGRHEHLQNPANLTYATAAAEFGVSSSSVELPIDRGIEVLERSIVEFRRQLAHALTADGPYLIELHLPPLGNAWDGIWLTQGYEQMAAKA